MPHRVIAIIFVVTCGLAHLKIPVDPTEDVGAVASAVLDASPVLGDNVVALLVGATLAPDEACPARQCARVDASGDAEPDAEPDARAGQIQERRAAIARRPDLVSCPVDGESHAACARELLAARSTELLAKPRGVDGRCRGWDACDDRCVEARCGERPDQCFWIHPLGSGDVMQLWARSAAAREPRRALMQARADAGLLAPREVLGCEAGDLACAASSLAVFYERHVAKPAWAAGRTDGASVAFEVLPRPLPLSLPSEAGNATANALFPSVPASGSTYVRALFEQQTGYLSLQHLDHERHDGSLGACGAFGELRARRADAHTCVTARPSAPRPGEPTVVKTHFPFQSHDGALIRRVAAAAAIVRTVRNPVDNYVSWYRRWVSPPSCAYKRFSPAQFYARWLAHHAFWEATAPPHCVARYEDLFGSAEAAARLLDECLPGGGASVDVGRWNRVAAAYVRATPLPTCSLSAVDLDAFAALHERFRHVTEGRYGYRLVSNSSRARCGLVRSDLD